MLLALLAGCTNQQYPQQINQLCKMSLHPEHQVAPDATPLGLERAALVNKKVQPKRTKAMDMRFHWLRDRECQRQFRFYWRPGKLNYADYWTKHHPATHHNNVRRNYLTPLVALEMFRQEERRRKQDAKQPT